MLWRRTPVTRQEFNELHARLVKLEAERAERELDLSVLMEKLRRYLLSIRQRERRDRERQQEAEENEGPLDEISRMLIERRRGPNGISGLSG